jgi:RNA polymerase sigma factor (sigma-70 family)
MAPHDDSRIMKDVQEGEVEKLAILFERHHLSLYNFFLRLTGNGAASEDLVQDVFVRILKYRSSFQAQGPFAVWMYQIARNAHIDHIRKRRDKDTLPLDDQWAEAVSPEPPPEAALEFRRDRILIRKALDSLPEKKREVLLLSRFQDLKYREIAEILGSSEAAVKTIVHRSLKELGKAYAALQEGVTS